MAGQKKPNPIDVHVGKRVRLRRLALSMSQERLGNQLGITFQQVQKYEKGTNRIGASRLQQIASILQMPISFFFDGIDTGSDSAMSFAEDDSSTLVDFLATRDGLRLYKAFSSIDDPNVRRRVLDLVEAMAREKTIK